MGLFQRLAQFGRNLIHGPHLLFSVGLASFLEATIIPIPLEALLVPLMQAKRQQLWGIAMAALIGCVLGALAGYTLGFWLFDMLRPWLVEYGVSAERLAHLSQQVQQQGFWWVLSLGVAPVPFQLAMLAAGAGGMNLGLFLLATFLARTLRYLGLALVVYLLGNKAEKLIKQYRLSATLLLSGLILLSWWVWA